MGVKQKHTTKKNFSHFFYEKYAISQLPGTHHLFRCAFSHLPKPMFLIIVNVGIFRDQSSPYMMTSLRWKTIGKCARVLVQRWL